jgi:hypothetical protein
VIQHIENMPSALLYQHSLLRFINAHFSPFSLAFSF